MGIDIQLMTVGYLVSFGQIRKGLSGFEPLSDRHPDPVKFAKTVKSGSYRRVLSSIFDNFYRLDTRQLSDKRNTFHRFKFLFLMWYNNGTFVIALSLNVHVLHLNCPVSENFLYKWETE